MRNPDRIEPFLCEIGKVWREKFPDWRFGQLMYNFFSVLGDPFYYEEDEFLVALKAYGKREDPKVAVENYREQKAEKRKAEKRKDENGNSIAEASAKFKKEMDEFFKNFDFVAFQENMKKEMEEIDKIAENGEIAESSGRAESSGIKETDDFK